jgi:hypothetical protein
MIIPEIAKKILIFDAYSQLIRVRTLLFGTLGRQPQELMEIQEKVLEPLRYRREDCSWSCGTSGRRMFHELLEPKERMEPRPYNTLLPVYPVLVGYDWFDVHGTVGRGY